MRRASLALFVLLSAGCALESPPSTLKIDGIGPREVDLGDRLEVAGAGFPLRRLAHLRFVGRLLHPGAPAEAADFEVDVEARSEGRLTVPLDESLVARFTGRGDRAAHATFRGEIRVTFDPIEGGTAKLVGSIPGVVLDVRPGRLARSEARLAAEGARLLDWMGVTVAAQAPASGGLLAAKVTLGSPADAAGIASGDVISELDGLQVFAVSDLAPARDVVTLGVRRQGAGTPQPVTLKPPGLAERVPRDLLASALLSGFFAIVLLLPFARTPRLLAALGHGGALRRVRLEALDAGVVAAAGGLVALGVRLAPAEADVLAAFLGAGFAALATGLFSRRSALAAATSQIPGAIAIGAVVASTGSLRLSDLAATQGVRPWEWAVAKAPPMALLLGAWALAVARRADLGGRVAHAIHLATFAVLGSVLFLGGAIASDDPRPVAVLLSTFAVLALKSLALAGLAVGVRRVDGRRGLGLPVGLGVAGAVGSIAWSTLVTSERVRALVGPATCALVATALLVSILEALHARRTVTVQHVDPHC